MKKNLLLSLLALSTLTLQAQKRLPLPVQAQADAQTMEAYHNLLQQRLLHQPPTIHSVNPAIKADTKSSTFFYRPTGIYFLGPDADFSAPNGRCIAPANMPLGTEANVTSGQFDWRFYDLDEETNKVIEKTQKDKELVFTLPEGRYPAPVLVGHSSESNVEMDSVYTFTTDSIEYGNGFNPNFYACNFDPTAGLTTVAVNFFYMNDSAANAGLGNLISKNAKNTKLKTFEEFFEYSDKPYYLLGGAAHLYSEHEITPEDLRITFKKLVETEDQEGNDSVYEVTLDDAAIITEIIPSEGNIYYVRYKVPSKPQIDAPISMVIAPTNDNVKFTPLFIPQKIYNQDNEGGYAYITLDYSLHDIQYTNEPLEVSGFNFNGGTFMSWMMGLFMTYDKDLATGIEQVNISNPQVLNGIYNLQGQRIRKAPQALEKGLYIINGKKIMVK